MRADNFKLIGNLVAEKLVSHSNTGEYSQIIGDKFKILVRKTNITL